MMPVTREEVQIASAKLGTAKAVGADGIPSEFLTHASLGRDHTTHMHDALACLFSAVLRTGHMPAEWKTKLVTPVFKKGDPTLPSNYRPISVATSLYRLFAAVLARRLTTYVDDRAGHLAPSQFAFQKSLSTDHAHWILQTCIDTARAGRRPLAVIHLDIEKAYDTVMRHILWTKLAAQGIPPDFIRMVQEVYNDCWYHIKVNGELSHGFRPDTGMQQGCPWSPWAYNEYIAQRMKEIHGKCQHMGVHLHTVHREPCTHVNFADDIIGTVYLEHLEEFVAIVKDVLTPINQHLNMDKVKVLVVQDQPYTSPTVSSFQAVQRIKLMGLL